jgi:hypothetical protein
MRIFLLVFLAAIFLAGTVFGDAKRTNDTELINSFIRDLFLCNGTNLPNWAFSVEDNAVPMDELRAAFTRGLEQFSQSSQGQPVDTNTLKHEIFNNTLLSTVIARKAMEDGLFNDPDARISLRLALRQALVQIYLARMLPKDTNRFAPTKEEVSDFYNHNREKFDQTGASADQIRSYIVNQLSGQKMQLWMSQQMDKAKEQYRVRRNDALLTNEGFN